MTAERLQSILQSENKITLSEIKQIIYELKNDCIGANDVTNEYKCGYFNGEVNAFYICLDLLDKLDVSKDFLKWDEIVSTIIPNLACSKCERDVIICKEEGRCMKEYSNG